jgi:hypothetical protein
MLGLLLSLLLQAPVCPPQTIETSRNEATLVLTCKEISELKSADLPLVTPAALSRLSPEDRQAYYRKEALLLMQGAASQLPFASDADVAELEAALAAEARDPVLFSLLMAGGLALGAVGSAMWAGVRGIPYQWRAGMVVGALVGGGVAALGYLAGFGGLPALTGASRVTVARIAVGFAPGTGQTALEPGRIQKAAQHLTDAKVIGNYNSAVGAELHAAFERILEHPRVTFDHLLKGRVPSRGFSGMLNGQEIVVFVHKAGDRVGKMSTAVLPSSYQQKNWGLK